MELRPGKPALAPAVAVPTVAAAGKRGMRLQPYNTRHGLLRQPDPLPQAQAPVRGERLSHALPPVLLDLLFRPMSRAGGGNLPARDFCPYCFTRYSACPKKAVNGVGRGIVLEYRPPYHRERYRFFRQPVINPTLRNLLFCGKV